MSLSTKIIVWLISLFLIFGVGTWLHTSIIPPTTSDVAVRQTENSDEAYQSLREHEMFKNWLTIGEVSLAVLVTIIIFASNIKKSYEKLVLEN